MMAKLDEALLPSAEIRNNMLTNVRCETGQLRDKIRQEIKTHARLELDVGQLSDSADLYEAGMTSHATVMLMLALENQFELEFPDSMLSRGVFESIDAIAVAITSLQSPESL
jgi:acyl carrier protein